MNAWALEQLKALLQARMSWQQAESAVQDIQDWMQRNSLTFAPENYDRQIEEWV